MWRVRDQFRKRPGPMEHLRDTSSSTTENGPGAFHSISSASVELERIWNEEWDRNLIQAVLDRVKQKVNLKDYQLFDLVVIREWSVSKVARLLKVSNCRVYLAKHRINKLVRAELKKIRAEAL